MKHNDRWFKLDTAGNLYPAIESLKYTGIFRISAALKDEINPAVLQEAANRVIVRFPSMHVRMKRGLFWFYLEKNNKLPKVKKDIHYPCRRLHRKSNNEYLLRILYKDRIVSLEIFHALTDGSGALIFLQTLIAEYLRILGIDIPYTPGILDYRETPDPEEYENSFTRYYKGRMKRKVKEPPVFHPSGTQLPSSMYIETSGEIKVEYLLKKARELGVTITEYLTAVMAYGLYRIQENQKRRRSRKAIRVSVPLNLRSYYPSKTLRNFSMFIKPGINPELGDYTFDEILHQIHHEMRYELSEKYISAAMGANVTIEQNPIVRAVPLFLKNIIMSIVFNKFGENRLSATVSNLGKVELPEVMQEYVDQISMLLGPNNINPVNCSVISYNGKLRITIGRSIREADLERLIFTHFVNEGIPIKISTDTPI